MKKFIDFITKGKLTAMLGSGAIALFFYIVSYYLQDYIIEPILKAMMIVAATFGIVFGIYFVLWLLYGLIINPIKKWIWRN